MNETVIKTPAAKLTKYAERSLLHFSYRLMTTMPRVVTAHATVLAASTIANLLVSTFRPLV